MNGSKNTLLCRKSLRAIAGSSSRAYHCVPVFLGIMLGTAFTQVNAVLVPEGSNLTVALNGATSVEHTFELEGDVNMSSAFYMNSENHRRIIIDGSLGSDLRGIISRGGTAYRFNVSWDLSELTIKNSVIQQTAGSGGGGAIYVTAKNSSLNFDNTTFTGNTAGDALGYGAAISMLSGTHTTISGKVSFIGNTSTGQGAGAVGVYGASSATRSRVTFLGETLFEDNISGYYGGAVVVNYYADAIFTEKAIFRNNHATTYYGGALDIYGGESYVLRRSESLDS